MIVQILFLLLLLKPSLSYAQGIKITVSSQPIANIVQLLTQDAQIDIIAPSGSCPHEYILKPSDFTKIQDSSVVIYMSDNFEPFIKPITANSDATIINLSNKLNLKPTHNMHIWMSLENVKNIAQIISSVLNIPSDYATTKIAALSQYKKTQLSGLTSVLLLSDSLEYLFEDLPHIKISHMYLKPGMTSIRDITTLSNQNPNICILINDSANVESIESKLANTKSGYKLVSVASENWSLEGYKKIIDDIKSRCIKNISIKTNGASDGN